MEAMDTRSGHGVPLDEMHDDPFVRGLVEWTAEEVGNPKPFSVKPARRSKQR